MSGNDFSSRVRNMKFMKLADQKVVEEEEEQKKKKLQDLSEWKLPSSEGLLRKVKQEKRKIKTIGYSQVNTIYSNQDSTSIAPAPLVGRRAFGEDKAKPKTASQSNPDEEADENVTNKGEEYDDAYEPTIESKSNSLVALWAKNKNSKRRPQGNGKDSNKKRKVDN